MSAETLHELIATLARTADTIAAQIAGMSDADLRRRKDDYGFSVVETVCHLRDIEVEGYTVRIDRLLNEDQPSLPDIDGGRLAAERDYNSQNIAEALAAFAQARARNVLRLRDLAPEQVVRAGTLEGVGAVTLEELLLMMQEHDAGHTEDLSILDRSARAAASE